MAKGGNNQRSNGSRFTKPYDASNSFVRKVALRVSDYIGGLFGSSTRSNGSGSEDKSSVKAADETTMVHQHSEAADSSKSLGMPARYDDVCANDSPAKRLKISSKRKFVTDLPVSPIASTSSLFQPSVNHNFDIQSGEDFITSVAGPSGLQNQKYSQTNSIATPSSTNKNIKTNGANDNHSDSSESTSGCSSLVPQSDRLSQSVFVSNSRKKILEDKLQYARQLKQSRASMYLNRSIPVVSDTAGNRRKPSFNVSAYGAPILDKSSVREKMINSPFYTGQTSYGGASAYKRPRTAMYAAQGSAKGAFERRDGVQIQVRPSHRGSTEDLSNMSHTAKRILEALEQFSTPVSDAKRIPLSATNPPLGRKRKHADDSFDSSRLSSTLKTSPNQQSKGPLISGLNIPTVPDLLKLKRLERIQDSTAAARQVAVPKLPEYTLPTEVQAEKHTGKIKTKLKDKDKGADMNRPAEVNLPAIPLPITTLPKFDFKLPPVSVVVPPPADKAPASSKSATSLSSAAAAASSPASSSSSTSTSSLPPTPAPRDAKPSETKKTFEFSPPIALPVPESAKAPARKSSFTFSTPIAADAGRVKSATALMSNFMSPEAIAKLKKKQPQSEKSTPPSGIEPPKELKSGSVMDLLRKSLEGGKKPGEKESAEPTKTAADTWECATCLIRNLSDSKNCSGCKSPKASAGSKAKAPTPCASPVAAAAPAPAPRLEKPAPAGVEIGFGNRFKPPSDSWSCKECFVTNTASAAKCVACENPKPGSTAPAPVKEPPPPKADGFGDMFKKKAGQWECSVCMIQNKEADSKCAACETPKPGAKGAEDKPTNPPPPPPPSAPSAPKFNFGIPPDANLFKFGVDKAGSKGGEAGATTPMVFGVQPNGPHPTPQFTFGIPPSLQQKTEKEPEAKSEAPRPAKSVEVEKAASDGGPAPPPPPPASVAAAVPDAEAKKAAEEPKSTTFKTATFPKTFSFGSADSKAVFTFGAQDAAKTEGDAGKATFGVKPNADGVQPATTTTTTAAAAGAGFSFGQANPDLSKSASFPKFSFAAKDASSEASKGGAETTTTTTTANSVFGTTSPMFNDSTTKKAAFGGSGSDFGAASDVFNKGGAQQGFPPTTAANMFGGSVFNGPPAANSFGATPTTAQQGFGGGFAPAAKTSSAPSSVPLFGQPDFGAFGRTANNNNSSSSSNFAFSSNRGGFGASPSTFTFGQPASDKPFIFGDGGNKAASTPAAAAAATTTAPPVQTTAANVFTFGSTKAEAKAPAFASGFGQGATPFAFGSPNPAGSGSLFGNFNAPKSGSPFGNAKSVFGNSFGQGYGSTVFGGSGGGTNPKVFEFGSSSAQQQQQQQQQQQAASQPFEFEAQAQGNAAPPTTFSMSIPQSFNFSEGETPVSAATPPSSATRKVIKAVRRTQR